MSLVDIRGLTIALPPGADRALAVEDVRLEIGANEIVCIVGESGSGKSLTAHAIMGLLPRGVRPRAARSCSTASTCCANRPTRCASGAAATSP